jgi:hypothetical protein
MTAPRRSHFAMIPKLVDELGLDPYAYRLYGHIKTVTGETGRCWQSTRTLAAACGMSPGRVTAAKRTLVAAGVIRIEKGGGSGGRTDVITPVDLWSRNHAHYAKRSQSDKPRSQSDKPRSQSDKPRSQSDKPRSRDEMSRSRDETSRSRDETSRSRGEHSVSPREPKKSLYEEDPLREEQKEEVLSSLSKKPEQRPTDAPPQAADWPIVLERLKSMMMRDDFATLFAPTRWLGVDDDGAWRIAVPGHYHLETLNRQRIRLLLSRGLRYAGVPDVEVRYELREPSDGGCPSSM